MKILFISRLYPNEYNTREGAVIHSQALELKKRGIDVRVLSPLPYMPRVFKNFRANWEEYYTLPKEYEYQGIKVYHPRFIRIPFGIYDNNMDTLLIKSIKRIIDDIYQEFPFNLVHAHMGFPDGLVGVYVKEKFKVPLITSVRTSDTVLRSKNKIIKRKIKSSLNYSDAIISPSIQIAKKIKTGFGKHSIHIGNGIYPNRLKKETKDLEINPSFFAELDNKTVIVSVSNLIERKGIKYNIYAISKLIQFFPNIIYLIIGDGPEMPNLKEIVSELNLHKYVKFLGDLSHHKAMQYVSISDIFTLPSWRETFGLVYLEAMFFNKPVILCEGEALDGSIKHNINGITVTPRSIDSLVSNLKRLLTDRKYRNLLAKNGNELVLNNYTWEIVGKKLIDLYRSNL